MGHKRIDQSPCVGDVVLLEIDTPDEQGVFTVDPVRIDQVAVFFAERSFDKEASLASYEQRHTSNPVLRQKLEVARRLSLAEPSPENVAQLMRVEKKAGAASLKSEITIKDARLVWGLKPAWEPEQPSFLRRAAREDPAPVLGRFTVEWDSFGARAGQYLVYWKWTMAGGQALANQRLFTLSAGKTSEHRKLRHTDPDKYDLLLDRYIPRAYKGPVSPEDLTPGVLKNLNRSVARGFTDVEEQANQVIDLLDAAAAPEAVLPLLAGTVGVRLKSDHPTHWRRQILQAVPTFKQKGTLKGLASALEQCGARLQKLTRLWQVVSPYTWTDGFAVTESPTSFELTFTPLPVTPSYFFEAAVRKAGELEYRSAQVTPESFVPPLEPGGKSLFVWKGEPLAGGDYLRVTYQYRDMPQDQESVEKHVRTLPLADLRDETDQKYPLKNWNVRVIEEDSPLFHVVVNERHPSRPPVVFGKVRSTFMFSENVYNMDAYNGSLRDSLNPCDIDRNFLDRCSGCQSGLFTADVEVSGLSDDRLVEIAEVIREYSPFHAVLHSLNVSGLHSSHVAVREEVTCKVEAGQPGMESSVKPQEEILFEVEWPDGTKDTGVVEDLVSLKPPRSMSEKYQKTKWV